jgi:hypothetical protein
MPNRNNSIKAVSVILYNIDEGLTEKIRCVFEERFTPASFAILKPSKGADLLQGNLCFFRIFTADNLKNFIVSPNSAVIYVSEDERLISELYLSGKRVLPLNATYRTVAKEIDWFINEFSFQEVTLK